LSKFWTVTTIAVLTLTITFTSASASTNDAHFTWEDRSAAEAHFVKRFGGGLSRNTILLQQAQELTHRVFSAYQNLYPQFMRNKQIPVVILTDSQLSFEAFAFMPRTHGPRRGMLVMAEGLIKRTGIDEDTQLGIVAHELAHILFWHQDLEGTPLRPIGRSGQPVEPETEAAFSRWMFLANIAGGHSHPAFNGLPINGLLSDEIRSTIELLRETGRDDCGTKLVEELETSTSQIMANYSFYLWDFDLDSSASAENVQRRSNELIEKISTCLEKQPHLNQRFLQSRRYRINGRMHSAPQVLSQVSNSLNIPASSDFHLVIQATRLAHQEMNRLFTNHGLGQVRWYSSEDQADEVAVSVLKHLNKDHRKFARGLLSAIEMPEHDSRRCQIDLDSASEPPYGNLSDLHHSICWRAWRLIKLGDPQFR
jgi:hypothetical protein